jgi:hypothetical protein
VLDDHQSEVGFPSVPALSHRSRPQNGMAGCNREDSTTFVPTFHPAPFFTFHSIPSPLGNNTKWQSERTRRSLHYWTASIGTHQRGTGPSSTFAHSEPTPNVSICRCSKSVDYATVNLTGQSIWPAIFALTLNKSHLLAWSVTKLTFESKASILFFASPLT